MSVTLEEPFKKKTFFRQVSEILISSGNLLFLTQEVLHPIVKNDIKTYTLTSFKIKYVLRMLMFSVTNSMRISIGHFRNMKAFKKRINIFWKNVLNIFLKIQ